MRNPTPSSYENYIYLHLVAATHRFTTDEGDWGFTHFGELRKIFHITEGKERPLVENDAANVTAYVRVYNDPTGVLWHNFVKLDSPDSSIKFYYPTDNKLVMIPRRKLDTLVLKTREPHAI